LRSPDVVIAHARPRLAPLLIKELWAIISGRALWTMLLLLCPIVGYSFFQAVALYAEPSAAASGSPILASGLSPLDGVLVPTFGAFYVTVTLLFPFVAIRALGREMETGTIRMLAQLPYRASTLVAAKMIAVAVAWLIALLPALSALAIWAALGGHLYAPETLNLLLGHFLYGMLIGSIALFAASIAESAATAAIMTLAVTIGSWVLDFTLAGRPGLLDWIAQLSLTQILRPFEQGLFSVGLVVGSVATVLGFATLAAGCLHPGISLRTKLTRSFACFAVMGAVLAAATQIRTEIDVTEDRRNSFPAADQRALRELREPLAITVHMAPEDPRYVDLRWNILMKLERSLPDVRVRLVATGQTVVGSVSEKTYGDVEYVYGGRSDTSRSTSHREILPLLYALAGVSPPKPAAAEDYPGYPLEANAHAALPWFFGALPLLIIAAWWWSSRPPRSRFQSVEEGANP
jgi:ABC-type transport system involved in multi-copper enzyme maturation permease subunit